jgi:hypothetical protein
MVFGMGIDKPTVLPNGGPSVSYHECANICAKLARTWSPALDESPPEYVRKWNPLIQDSSVDGPAVDSQARTDGAFHIALLMGQACLCSGAEATESLVHASDILAIRRDVGRVNAILEVPHK